jgi:hypothetical protein
MWTCPVYNHTYCNGFSPRSLTEHLLNIHHSQESETWIRQKREKVVTFVKLSSSFKRPVGEQQLHSIQRMHLRTWSCVPLIQMFFPEEKFLLRRQQIDVIPQTFVKLSLSAYGVTYGNIMQFSVPGRGFA